MARHPIRYGVILFFLTYIVVITYFQGLHKRALKSASARNGNDDDLNNKASSTTGEHPRQQQQHQQKQQKQQQQGVVASSLSSHGEPGAIARGASASVDSSTFGGGLRDAETATRKSSASRPPRPPPTPPAGASASQSEAAGKISGSGGEIRVDDGDPRRPRDSGSSSGNGGGGKHIDSSSQHVTDLASRSRTEQPAPLGLRPLVPERQEEDGEREGEAEEDGKGLRPLAEFAGGHKEGEGLGQGELEVSGVCLVCRYFAGLLHVF